MQLLDTLLDRFRVLPDLVAVGVILNSLFIVVNIEVSLGVNIVRPRLLRLPFRGEYDVLAGFTLFYCRLVGICIDRLKVIGWLGFLHQKGARRLQLYITDMVSPAKRHV